MSTPVPSLRSIKQLPIENKRVFLRVDFDVPLEDGKVTDDSRIREAVPTIQHALERGARLVCASHLGQPKKGPDPKLSLEPCAARLAEILGQDVTLPEDCVGDAAKKVVFDLRGGQVCLLENLRFYPQEEKDDESFCRELSTLADVYVDDAFACVHRAHASVHGLAKLYRDRGCGLVLEKEIGALGKIVTDPDRPYVAILGGATGSNQFAVVDSLLERVTALVLGGAVANTFLAALGSNMQASAVQSDKLALARTILDKARAKGVDVLLPVDLAVAASSEASASEVETVGVDAVPAGKMALDIGPRSIEALLRRLAGARTIFWSGSMGLFDKAPFAAGTFAVARALADSSGFVVVGGGESAAAARAAGEAIASKMTHISTGGEASLEFVEGRKLPGIEVLRSVPG